MLQDPSLMLQLQLSHGEEFYVLEIKLDTIRKSALSSIRFKGYGFASFQMNVGFSVESC